MQVQGFRESSRSANLVTVFSISRTTVTRSPFETQGDQIAASSAGCADDDQAALDVDGADPPGRG